MPIVEKISKVKKTKVAAEKGIVVFLRMWKSDDLESIFTNQPCDLGQINQHCFFTGKPNTYFSHRIVRIESKTLCLDISTCLYSLP